MALVKGRAVSEELLLQKSKFQNGLNGKERFGYRIAGYNITSVHLNWIIFLFTLLNLLVAFASSAIEPKAQLTSPGNNSTMNWIDQALEMRMLYMPDTLFWSIMLVLQCIYMYVFNYK